MLTEDVKRIRELVKNNEPLMGHDWRKFLQMNADILPVIEKEVIDPNTGEIKHYRQVNYGIDRKEAMQILRRNGRI